MSALQEVCRLVIIMIQYMGTAVFVWTVFDNYMTWSFMAQKEKLFLPIKLFFFVFGKPLQYDVMFILINLVPLIINI